MLWALRPRKMRSRLASPAPFFADDEALAPVNPRFIAFAMRSLVKPFGGDELKSDRMVPRFDVKFSIGTTSRCAAGEDPYRHV